MAKSSSGKNPRGSVKPGNKDNIQDPAVEFDPFEDLFGDGSEDITVELIRTQPQFHQGYNIEGFCERLPAGADRQYIKDRYGGGTFRLSRKIKGRYKDNRLITISGPPDVTEYIKNQEALSKEDPEPRPDPQDFYDQPAGRLVDGVSIGAPDQQFFRELKQVVILKTLLQDREPNDLLLKFLIDKSEPKGDNAIEQLGQLKEVLEFMEYMRPSNDSDSGILNQLLPIFNKLVAQPSKAPAPHPGLKSVTSNPALKNAASVWPKDPGSGPAASDNRKADSNMGIQDILSDALELISGAFLLDPRPEPDQIAELLNKKLPPIVNQFKSVIQAQKSEIKLNAEIMMADEFRDNPENRSEFSAYFDSIFDKFISGPRDQAQAQGGPSGAL